MRLIRWMFWGSIALILIGFAIANRHPVIVSVDPTDASAPLFALEMPLYLAVFSGLLAGLLIGGMATWLKQGKYRSTVRQQGRELERIHRQEPDVVEPKTDKNDGIPPITPGRKLQPQSAVLTSGTSTAEGSDDRAA